MPDIVEGLKAQLKETHNLAKKFDQEVLDKLGQEVVNNYDVDKNAMSEWEDQVRDALKLAKQVKEAKSTPWENAANVKYPLMTVAAIQFAARAYPEIVKGKEIVQVDITGKDLDNSKRLRGSRVECHMNYQLTKEMEEWESDTDQLLHILPVVGMVWRKTYYDSPKKRNVSELIMPDDCTINKKARTEDTARRITHRYWLFKNDIWERQAAGVWLEFQEQKSGNNPEIPEARGDESGDEKETDVPHEILEQHRYYDLDGDGYAEPYIITVHKETSQVMRIMPRYEEKGIVTNDKGKLLKINPTNYFVLYTFIPNPDGSIFSLGFGHLLEPLNETINTLINQLIDAGTMANAGAGLIGKGIKIKGGVLAFRPNEYQIVDTSGQSLKDNVFPLPVKEPSAVLFQLLGFLVQAAKDVTSVQDILGGDVKMAANMPATTMMALIEQGLKVYVAIYKRIYRSLTKEFRNLYRLNANYLDLEQYMKVIGNQWEPPKEKQPQMPGNIPGMPPLGGGLPPGGPPPMQIPDMSQGMGLPMQESMGEMGNPMMPPMQGLPGLPMPMGAGALGLGIGAENDYKADDLTVLPVADPNMSTDMLRMAKMQAVAAMRGSPGLNEIEITREQIHAIRPLNEDKILLSDAQVTGQEPSTWKPPVPPQMLMAQARLIAAQAQAMESQQRAQMDRERFALEMEELMAKIAKLKADTTLSMAKAESELNEDALAYYKTEVEAIVREADIKIAMMKEQAAAQQQMAMAAQQQGGPGGAAGVQAKQGRVSPVANVPGGARGVPVHK